MDDVADEALTTEMNQRLMWLGLVVENSAKLEGALRSAFCALVGSKYAVIVAAGQNTAWLIEQCRALTKAHRDISEEHQAAILEVLDAASQANGQRRTMVHHEWTGTSKNGASLVGSKRLTHEMTVDGPIVADTVGTLAANLLKTSVELHGAITQALGSDATLLDQALSWEDRQGTQGR
jgi:hypothetical protein